MSAAETESANRYLLFLGSNQDPERKLDLANAGLRRAFAGLQLSSRQASPAREGGDVADYINQAALIRSDLDPAALKQRLRAVEKVLGRVRPNPNPGECPIDIDLIARLDPKTVAIAPEDLEDPAARALCGELIGDLLPVLRGLA